MKKQKKKRLIVINHVEKDGYSLGFIQINLVLLLRKLTMAKI